MGTVVHDQVDFIPVLVVDELAEAGDSGVGQALHKYNFCLDFVGYGGVDGWVDSSVLFPPGPLLILVFFLRMNRLYFLAATNSCEAVSRISLILE